MVMARRFLVSLTTVLGLLAGARASAEDVIVFAAASLTDALTEASEVYAASGQPKPVLSFAASSALARQIENAAPAGIFFSADEQWMDYLAERALIEPATRISLLGNSLVLIAPKDSPLELDIGLGFPLAEALGDGRLAIADPDHVPVGRYAKAALENLGVWGSLESRLARTEGVRGALALVARGEVPAGIVYKTDVAISDQIRVVATFPSISHPRISYPVALVKGQATPAARAFLDFITSDAALDIFRRHGFTTD